MMPFMAHSLDNFGVNDLMSLSLEDLIDIRVSTGGLTESTSATSASAITIIRQEQIELSAAKNLANLLEQHVPGLVLMEHSEGNKIGIRGLIAAENYKLLILVNGKNITNMVYEGAITELDLWDLGDIERIEVVRGPGSVTYGTGAIAGVINLITKNADSNIPITSVSLMNNQTYQSTGVNIQYRAKKDDIGMYSFL
jgi:outer membrane receptor for ferrienterochelin and colicin